MNTLAAIETNLVTIGYRREALRRDYTFADVFSDDAADCTVDLAAFTQVPESSRSAAFGVIAGGDADAAVAIAARRALGAPLFLSISEHHVSVWRVGASGAPIRIDTVTLDALDALFDHNAERWSPQALHRAKALAPALPQQMDFVDLGLLPAIEREVQTKLHRVLEDVLRLLLRSGADERREQAAFRATFRLLAAKILRDRNHSAAQGWALGDVRAVLEGISDYYRLGDPRAAQLLLGRDRLDAAWDRMIHSVSLQNISADALAFVYENTLVTADSRKRFGTHSTPRQVADYVLSRLDLSRYDRHSLRIHEPFAGAGAFLVSAVRHLQDILPVDWSPETRHEFLTQRLSGSELDSFACEVATLSLILADYPNANGWHVQRNDLFVDGVLARALRGSTLVLCNPPFEDFSAEERGRYAKATELSVSKAQFALKTVIAAAPEAIGFVLPHGVLQQTGFREARALLSRTYQSVELLSLPEGIFDHQRFPAALVIAREPRNEKSTGLIRVKAGRVTRSNRTEFLDAGRCTFSASAVRPVGSSDLWIGPLDELWEWLAAAPRLGAVIDVFRGIPWRCQAEGISDTPRNGFRRGISRPKESLRPFNLLPITRWLSFNAETLRRGGPPSRPWNKPKVLVNAAPRSRGAWRMDAALDDTGLAASQLFYGIWPRDGQISIQALAAILNGPLANAYVSERATDRHLTNKILEEIPMPSSLDESQLFGAVESYLASLDALDEGRSIDEAELDSGLRRIDELVLAGYGLPSHLRQLLLDYFAGYQRPVPHRFSGWETTLMLDPLHAARGRVVARGRRQKTMDLEAAGGGLALSAVSELLGKPKSEVERLAEEQVLFAVPSDNGLLFPRIQFEGNRTLPRLREVMAVFPDRNPWARLNYLVNPDQRLDGSRPIDRLRSGDVDRVIAAARQAGEHTAG